MFAFGCSPNSEGSSFSGSDLMYCVYSSIVAVAGNCNHLQTLSQCRIGGRSDGRREWVYLLVRGGVVEGVPVREHGGRIVVSEQAEQAAPVPVVGDAAAVVDVPGRVRQHLRHDTPRAAHQLTHSLAHTDTHSLTRSGTSAYSEMNMCSWEMQMRRSPSVNS